jgi:hypothetical protein
MERTVVVAVGYSVAILIRVTNITDAVAVPVFLARIGMEWTVVIAVGYSVTVVVFVTLIAFAVAITVALARVEDLHAVVHKVVDAVAVSIAGYVVATATATAATATGIVRRAAASFRTALAAAAGVAGRSAFAGDDVTGLDTVAERAVVAGSVRIAVEAGVGVFVAEACAARSGAPATRARRANAIVARAEQTVVTRGSVRQGRVFARSANTRIGRARIIIVAAGVVLTRTSLGWGA